MKLEIVAQLENERILKARLKGATAYEGKREREKWKFRAQRQLHEANLHKSF